MALSLTHSTTVTLQDGTVVEFALLVLPEEAWDLDGNGSLSAPADRAIIAATREGWHGILDDEDFVDEIDATVLTFWRKVQA
jgi:hypothetical protein